ncbi:hypothetical protein GALL_134320 [mine drainage metagenome]|uniref:HNH endonuclease n=1 Tax=mine drainage metagenome TaxID=410659 RepID=A0A1J5S8P1_9ZZZZ
MTQNQYGLSRTIDALTKRAVRQRCGFGCVNCGCAVYQYEHLDPTFADAKSHDSDCIVLLCGGCHDRVTRKLLSKETIKLKSKNPKCLEQGFSFGPFDLGVIEPEIIFGTLKCKAVLSLIRILGDDIFSIKPPESNGSPFLISAKLSDRDGNEILRIEDNEWITNSDNWDVEVVGTNITIRRELGDILLSLRSEPPSRLVIEKLEMSYRGTKISANENKSIKISKQTGQQLDAGGIRIEGCQVGIDIVETGLTIGTGGGRVMIESMTISQTRPNPITSRLSKLYPQLSLPPFKLNHLRKIINQWGK